MASRALAVIFAMIAGSLLAGDGSVMKSDGTRVRFRFSDNEIIVAMVDNSAARSLVEMLPLTLRFEDYAGSEKISSLPRKLDTSGVPAGYDPSAGDLTLYSPWGNLEFFYRDHGYANGLVPLGTIVSGAGLLEELDSAAEVRVETAEWSEFSDQ
jgi:hypothetical protein